MMSAIQVTGGGQASPASSDARVTGLWNVAPLTPWAGRRWSWSWRWIGRWVSDIRIVAEHQLTENTLFDEVDTADILAKNFGPSSKADIRTSKNAESGIHGKARLQLEVRLRKDKQVSTGKV